jgi:hypothetical protein
MEYAAPLSEVVPAVIIALTTHRGSLRVVQSAVWFLNGVAMSPDFRPAVLPSLPAVLAALTTHVSDGDAAHAAVSYLCWLSRSEASLAALAAHGGVVDAVREAVHMQPDVAMVQRWGEEVLGKLA